MSFRLFRCCKCKAVIGCEKNGGVVRSCEDCADRDTDKCPQNITIGLKPISSRRQVICVDCKEKSDER